MKYDETLKDIEIHLESANFLMKAIYDEEMDGVDRIYSSSHPLYRLSGRIKSFRHKVEKAIIDIYVIKDEVDYLNE